MHSNGMTPAEMIVAATADAAQTGGLGDVIGTLEVGNQADIILVNGDLFEFDDLRLFSRVAWVVKGGGLVVRPVEE